MEQTPKYGLQKPGSNDFADIAVLNANADKLDTALDGLEIKKETPAGAQAKADAALAAAKAASVPLAQKGVAGGVAPLGADGMIPLQHIPEEAKEQRVVANIAARDAIAKKFVGLSVYVKDATADPTVKRGGAYYLWDGAWGKTAEAESMDMSLTWDNVEGKPASFPPSGHSHSVSEVSGALRAFAPVNITLPVGSWSAGAPYTQTVSVAGVLASWDHRLGLSPQRIADRTAEKANDKAMGCITYCDTINGGITVTCRDKKPETNILVVLAGEV